MSGVASLSPKLQEYLLGAATDGTGGLATEVVFSLLRTVRSRVRERFTPPLQQQALSRAVTAALAQALSLLGHHGRGDHALPRPLPRVAIETGCVDRVPRTPGTD